MKNITIIKLQETTTNYKKLQETTRNNKTLQ